jgi:hypothetical protein
MTRTSASGAGTSFEAAASLNRVRLVCVCASVHFGCGVYAGAVALLSSSERLGRGSRPCVRAWYEPDADDRGGVPLVNVLQMQHGRCICMRKCGAAPTFTGAGSLRKGTATREVGPVTRVEAGGRNR